MFREIAMGGAGSYNIVRYEAVALADRRLFDQHHPTETAIAAR